jgi:integrase
MASITQRAGRFFVRVRQRGYPIASKTFTRLSDAKAWGRKVEVAMEAGTWAVDEAPTPTLKEAISEYRRVVASKMKGAKDYAYSFDHFEALGFASKAIDEVTPADLAKWRDAKLQAVKPSTVVRQLAMFSAVFSWAMRERGWIKENPAAMVKRPRVNDGRDRLLSPEERRYLLAAAGSSKAPWLPAALQALGASAMRRGELCSLRKCDVDLEAKVAKLADTKNGRPRLVPLSPAALEGLQALMIAAEKPEAPLIPVDAGSVSKRYAVTVRRARRAYEDDCTAAGVEPENRVLRDIRLHDERHGSISMWASTGLSLSQLMAVSGHRGRCPGVC